MRKKIELDETEKELFRSALGGTKLYTHTKIVPEQPKPKKRRRSDDTPAPFSFYDEENYQEISGDETLEFHRSGLQHKVLRKLRQGQYTIQATLDMHGMRVTDAKEALTSFLIRCSKKDIRHALIVHGKGHGIGKPVLKNKLNQWLRQVDQVLAFCSATPQQGRTGALYVLLKGGLLDE
jgi:DNA-nicking Smr family endonuclease